MHLLTQSALLKALGWSLFNSLWQMALLWLFYRILLSVLRTASAHARHGLAFLFLGIGVVSSTFTFFYQIIFSEDPSASVSWPDRIFEVGGFPGASFWQTGREFIDQVLPYCSFVYLLVLTFLFIRYCNQYFQSRQLKSQGLSRIQPELRVFVAETSRLMGIGKEVQVWLSSFIEGPVTLGFLKPVILIPVAMTSHLSPQQVEAILLHELAHVKRNDYLMHLGVTILEVLFFFNPFTRWLIRDIQREREHRCDDLVMQFRYDPHTYISALLSLATTKVGRQGSRQLALAATGGNDQILLKRVRRILKLRETKDRPGARALVFLLLALAGAGILLARSPYGGSQAHSSTAGEATWVSGSVPPTAVLTAESHFPIGPVLGTTRRNSSSVGESLSTSGTELASLTIVNEAPKAPSRSLLQCKKHPSPPVIERDEDRAPEDGFLVAAGDNSDAEAAPSDGSYAAIVQPDDDREYSMEPAVSVTVTAPVKKAVAQHQPFVPNSSFSFQIARDTLRLAEKYAYLQSLASHELEEAVKKMQKELQAQIRALNTTYSKEQRALLLAQKRILEEQLQLQEQFLRKQKELERKLERAGKVRRIVVI